MGHALLVIEDDEVTAASIVKGMKEAGFDVGRAATGSEGLTMASDGGYDILVLDRMLPQVDGMAVLGSLRAAGITTPVIMLSALGSADEKVAGLTSGADDYLAKPFAFAELLARVRLLLRRSQGSTATTTQLTWADLELDLLTRKVRRGGRPVDLQPREYLLVEYFMRHADQVVTRTMLLEGVWDYHFDPGTNVIDVHISRLRRKLEENHPVPILHTVRGVGYRLGAIPGDPCG